LSKALVLGAGGQLGSELARLLGPGSGVTRHEVSITDQAETEKDMAFAVNAYGAANVAIACARHGALLVHFSTNFVFDGTLERPYAEADPAAPLSVYAASKLEGEQRVLDHLPNALVIRSSALFGDTGSAIKGGSFPDRILARAQRGEPLVVVSDQKVNPTYTGDLAPAAIELAATGLDGVIHVVAAGCAGWDEFARAVLEESELPAPVSSILSAELSAAARRPLNGCLTSTRVAALRPWREGLREWSARRPR
jgi:dTDP-4-dehydrorhamnose reductase